MDNSRCCQHAGPSATPQHPETATATGVADSGGGCSGDLQQVAEGSPSSSTLLHSSDTSWSGTVAGLPAGRRPLVFDKMESLVREMQDLENGVPVRSQKLFLTSIPSAFMGYDLIEWLMERLSIDDSVEAIHTANLLCQHGYFFPVGECKNLIVKDDSSLYRFQTPYYWPSQNHNPENSEYVIYLYKRSLRNKQKHGLEEYEMEALSKLKKQLAHKWDFIVMQAEEQVRLAKDRKKGDKIVTDSQERAYWRAYRPPPGFLNCLELPPYPNVSTSNSSNAATSTSTSAPFLQDSSGRQWKNVEELKAEVEYLRTQLVRARIKVSVAAETLQQHSATYAEYDPFLPAGQPQPSNPWLSDDPSYWILNAPLVEVPTEKRVKKWAISIEDLVADQTGLQELTNYLRKEYSHENIRFWLATNQLRSGPASCIFQRVQEIYQEFLAPGAPCEINIDGRTMERVQQEMRRPSRFTFDQAAEHVYNLLLKKDCYPRFVRSEHYRQILLNALQPSQKKRFFNFGNTGKKKSISAASSGPVVPAGSIVQPQLNQHAHQSSGSCSSFKRRGSNGDGGLTGQRSPSGSPPDPSHVLQHMQQQPSSSILASSSASTVAASAGINAAPATANQQPLSTNSPASGDECDAPYRGDMPSTLRPSTAPLPLPSPTPYSSTTGCSSSGVTPVGNAPPPPTPPPPLTPTPPPPPQQSGSSCGESPPGQPDNVCPWESVSQPVMTGPGSNRTPRFLSVDLPSSSSQDPAVLLSPKRSSLCVDISGRPLLEGGRQRGGGTVTSPKPAATEADICPWESVSPPLAACGSPRSKSVKSPVPSLTGRKPSSAGLPSMETDVDPVCPWESHGQSETSAQSPRRLGSCSSNSSRTAAADETVPSKPAAAAAAVAAAAGSEVIPLNKNASPGMGRTASRKESMEATHQPPSSPAPSVPASTATKISDICPWEDEESCKMDQPFVKTYATLGYL